MQFHIFLLRRNVYSHDFASFVSFWRAGFTSTQYLSYSAETLLVHFKLYTRLRIKFAGKKMGVKLWTSI